MKTVLRMAFFSTRGESNCHAVSQIVGERIEDRGNAPSLLIVIFLQALGLGAVLATGTRSTADRRGNRKAGKNLPQPGRRRSQRLRHRPSALGLCGTSSLRLLRRARQAGQLGSMAGYRSGRGQAILDYYAPEDDAAPAEKCARSAAKARAVAMSIEDRRTDKWRQQAASLGDDRIRYLSGKRLRNYSVEELENSRSLPTCSAASPIPKTCPSSWRRC